MTETKQENKWKEISASWDGNEGYSAQTTSGAVVMMGKDKDGKSNAGPMELLLVGLAGCTMMDVVDILKKKRQVPVKFTVVVRGNQRIDEYPFRFTEFHIEYNFWGNTLTDKDVDQAIKLSEEKYCSVGGTLTKAGPIHSVYHIHKESE